MTEDEILKMIDNTNLLIAYFSTPDCSVCKVLRPEVERVVSTFPSVQFLYIDTSQHPMASGQYVVFAVPTIILFINGREKRRWSRHVSVQDIQVDLEQYVNLLNQ